jgi:predicted porin
MKKSFSSITLLLLTLVVHAQKGNNELQVAAHYGFPTGNLADITTGGYGAIAKGLYGFSRQKQQLSLSVGYTHFPVKESLSGDYNFFYSTLPVMVGYRYTFGTKSMDDGLYLEAQAGLNYNVVKGSASTGQSAKTTGTNFVFSPGIGYKFKGFDAAVFYQNSDLADSKDDITFFAIQLGYSFEF